MFRSLCQLGAIGVKSHLLVEDLLLNWIELHELSKISSGKRITSICFDFQGLASGDHLINWMSFSKVHEVHGKGCFSVFFKDLNIVRLSVCPSVLLCLVWQFLLKGLSAVSCPITNNILKNVFSLNWKSIVMHALCETSCPLSMLRTI